MEIQAISTLKHWILAIAMLIPRIAAVFSVIPFLSKLLHGQLRNSIIVSICLVMMPLVLPTVPPHMDSLLHFSAIVVKEAVLGMLLGFLISIPFWAIEGVGFIIDNQRGATMASVFDPMSGQQTSLYGSLLLQLAAVILFTSGGFLALVGVLFESYKIWPIDSFVPTPAGGFAIFFLDQMDYLMELMVLYAAPVVIAVFLAEFGLGLINRFAPQLNVFFLSMPIKSGIAGFLLILYLGVLEDSFRPKLLSMDQTIRFLNQVLK